MSRMRGNDHVGYTEETSSNDSSDLKTIKVLRLHLRQHPLQRPLYLLWRKNAKEHRFNFQSHEKEVPSCSMDRAIESECIRNLHHAPVPEAGFGFQPRKLRHSEPLFHENCSHFHGLWHEQLFPLRSALSILGRRANKNCSKVTTFAGSCDASANGLRIRAFGDLCSRCPLADYSR